MSVRSCLAAVFWVLCAVPALANDVPVGTVKTFTGDASIVTAGKAVKAQAETPVYLGSEIRTGSKSSIGVVFKDATVMSFGADTTLTVDEYVYGAAGTRPKFASRLAKGTLNYISGAIVKLNPESVAIRTPAGVIGVRGTQLLALVEPARAYVTLIASPDGTVGQVVVSGPGGTQTLTQPLQSVPINGSLPPVPANQAALQADFAQAIQARPPLPGGAPAQPQPGPAGTGSTPGAAGSSGAGTAGGAGAGTAGSAGAGTAGSAGAAGSTSGAAVGAGAGAGAGAQAAVTGALGGISAPVLGLGALVGAVAAATVQSGNTGTTGTTGTR